jgi:hypothetical protein
MHTTFFSVEAALFFDSLPPSRKDELTMQVWCKKCERRVPLGNLTGKMRGADLVLPAVCAFCGKAITQVVKASELKKPVS